METEKAEKVNSVLILGGTMEAKHLAQALSTDSVWSVIYSLAGRTRGPDVSGISPTAIRSGGFGGAPGLCDFMEAHGIAAVVDATHPFASQIRAHIRSAATARGTPMLRLTRPAWTEQHNDYWIRVPHLLAAANALSVLADCMSVERPLNVLLTIGSHGAKSFMAVPSTRIWLRAIESPAQPLPAHVELMHRRGPFALDDELALMRRLAIDALVSKNSGGTATYAKIEAARALERPVIMVDRPKEPDAFTVTDIAAALAWLAAIARRELPVSAVSRD